MRARGRYKDHPCFSKNYSSECAVRTRRCANVDADVSVASLAKASRLSRSQFIARYRVTFGDTPHQTRIRARLERAQWLLATTDLSVTDVCMAVGFSSLGSFSRLFRIRCGEPPLRYRARLRVHRRRIVARCSACTALRAAHGRRPGRSRSYFSRSAAARGAARVHRSKRNAGGLHADQALLDIRRRSSQGAAFLHRGSRLRESRATFPSASFAG